MPRSLDRPSIFRLHPHYAVRMIRSRLNLKIRPTPWTPFTPSRTSLLRLARLFAISTFVSAKIRRIYMLARLLARTWMAGQWPPRVTYVRLFGHITLFRRTNCVPCHACVWRTLLVTNHSERDTSVSRLTLQTAILPCVLSIHQACLSSSSPLTPWHKTTAAQGSPPYPFSRPPRNASSRSFRAVKAPLSSCSRAFVVSFSRILSCFPTHAVWTHTPLKTP